MHRANRHVPTPPSLGASRQVTPRNTYRKDKFDVVIVNPGQPVHPKPPQGKPLHYMNAAASHQAATPTVTASEVLEMQSKLNNLSVEHQDAIFKLIYSSFPASAEIRSDGSRSVRIDKLKPLEFLAVGEVIARKAALQTSVTSAVSEIPLTEPAAASRTGSSLPPINEKGDTAASRMAAWNEVPNTARFRNTNPPGVPSIQGVPLAQVVEKNMQCVSPEIQSQVLRNLLQLCPTACQRQTIIDTNELGQSQLIALADYLESIGLSIGGAWRSQRGDSLRNQLEGVIAVLSVEQTKLASNFAWKMAPNSVTVSRQYSIDFKAVPAAILSMVNNQMHEWSQRELTR